MDKVIIHIYSIVYPYEYRDSIQFPFILAEYIIQVYNKISVRNKLIPALNRNI